MIQRALALLLISAACKPTTSSAVSIPVDSGPAVAASASSAASADADTGAPCDERRLAIGDRWVYKVDLLVPLPNDAFSPAPIADQILTLRTVVGDRVTAADARWGTSTLRGCELAACGVAFARAPFGASTKARMGAALIDLVAHVESPRVEAKHVAHEDVPEPNEIYDVSILASDAQGGAGQLWFRDYDVRGRLRLRSSDGLLVSATFAGTVALWRRARGTEQPALPADQTADFSGSISRTCVRS